jgi:monothiol glutaredoxin
MLVKNNKSIKMNNKPILKSKIDLLINSHKIFAFIKGTPSIPRCGFTNQLFIILDEYDISFSTYNILEDFEMREAIKLFSNWPTFPQLYVDSSLIGGIDIVSNLHNTNKLSNIFEN